MNSQKLFHALALLRLHLVARRASLASKERSGRRGAIDPAHSPQAVEREDTSIAADLVGMALMLVVILLLAATLAHAASSDDTLASRKPEAAINLASKEGAQLVKGECRFDSGVFDLAG